MISDDDDDTGGFNTSRITRNDTGSAEGSGGEGDSEEEEDEEEQRKTIPPELLTRILHEFFEDKERTRITRDANDAIAKYVDVFVREAIARAAVESGRSGGFLEVCLSLPLSLTSLHMVEV